RRFPGEAGEARQPGQERSGVWKAHAPEGASASIRAKRARRSRSIGRRIGSRAGRASTRAGAAPGARASQTLAALGSSERRLAAAKAGGRSKNVDIGV